MFSWLPGGGMTAAAVGAASLLPGVGGAATGLGLLGGTGFMALSGAMGAVSSGIQAQNTPGVPASQQAAQQFANQVQATQAQQQLTAAQTQQAHDQVTTAQAVSQAQSSLAESQRNAAASQVQALQSVTQAEQGVQQATYNLSEANYNLGQAYQQARQQITQLNDQLADSKLSVASASLAVQQAEYQEKLVNQDAYSTSIDRQQAALAVAQAKQQVTDATDQESNAQYAATLANKQGVNGSQTVIQAKQAQVAATQQLKNSQQAASAAQTALQNTELNNTAQLKTAELQLSQARQQQAWTAQQDALAVSEAQANLTNTLKEQKLQWAAMLASANQAEQQFGFDMSKLTPAGRSFVDAVMQMVGPFKQLEAVAQNTVLPGMTIWLNGIKSLLPEVSKGVSEMGAAMGSSFAQFGKYMQTPAFAKTLDGLIANGMKFANTVLPAVATFIQDLARVGAQKGAVDGLAGVLAGLADGLGNLVNGLGPFVTGLSSLWSGLGKALADLGGPLGEVIGALGSALAPAVQALLPGFKVLTSALGSGLSKALIGLAPLMGVLGTGISQIVEAFTPLLPQVGTLIGQLGTDLAPLVKALLPAFENLAQSMAGQLGQSLGLVIPLVTNLLPPLVGLAVKLSPLIDLAIELSTKMSMMSLEIGSHVGPAILWLWHEVFEPAFTGIGKIAVWLYDNAIRPLWDDWIKPVFDHIESGVDLLSKHWSTVWAGMTAGIVAPVNFLITTVYDHGIARLWNDVVGAVGLKSLKLPVIPALAGGGVLPGYAPGHDSVPALLSPGEAVLTPGATRAVGGAPVINALNAAYAPSRGGSGSGHFAQGGTVSGEDEQGSGSSGSAGGEAGKLAGKEAEKRTVERPAEHAATLGMLANGGIVQRFSLGGIVSGLLSGGGDTAKAIAALATGNTVAFTNALSGLIGTSAAGSLGQVMVALPKTLVTDAAKAAMGMMGGSSGGSSGGGALTPAVRDWFNKAVAVTGVGMSWAPDLETIGQHESSFNPSAINLSDSNAAAGDPSKGIMQLISTTFSEYHQPGTSPNIFEPVANIAAGINYIKGRYGNPGDVPGIISLAQGGKYVGYDSGGVLPPGMTAGVNMTGKPEAVLTPQQTQALESLVSRPAGAAGQAPMVNLNYYGPQEPSPEQKAIMLRDLSLLLGG